MTTVIPRVLHQLWTPAKTLPLGIGEMMGGWRALHPGFDYRFWTERNLPALVNQEIWDKAEAISPNAPEQLRSDVARYEILYRYGGIWVDADFICQKPIDPLMVGTEAFAGQETSRWLNNALIGVTARSPFMLELIERLPQNVIRHPVNRGNNVKTGPQFFTPIARRHRITEYPSSFFYPYGWNELDRGSEEFPDAYAVHTWNNQRRLRSRPLVGS